MAHSAGAKKDLYKVLNVSKNASQHEIKKAYRKLALALHPDHNDGDEAKVDKFREASEAYDTLSDHKKRTEYDSLHSQSTLFERAQRHSHYSSKVYAPRPPPNFKIFDHERHYRMHYGDGQMEEALEQARKRAKEAGGKEEYVSPLGKGFTFEGGSTGGNPYASRRRRNEAASEDILYEEIHFYDSNSSNMSEAKRVVHARERVRTRMKERREHREPRKRDMTSRKQLEQDGCAIM